MLLSHAIELEKDAQQSAWVEPHGANDTFGAIRAILPDVWATDTFSLDRESISSTEWWVNSQPVYHYLVDALRVRPRESTSSDDHESEMFHRGVQSLADAGQLQSGVVAVYDKVGDLCASRRFQECDQLLAAARPHEMDVDLLLSLYLSTERCKSQLRHRDSFAASMRRRMVDVLGESETREILGSVS